ncbi:hypothetical protein [Ruegeria arenilitoris]|uniref:hypothetical protein n=1 Tax=Ruegeria arenilitoris TaxID=1173585 RepID=UPI00147F4782|nr:hypothetical protein [Ruegeria arenilitoris]
MAAMTVCIQFQFAAPAFAQASPPKCSENLEKTASFTFDGQTQSFFVGYRWGEGVLTLSNGQEFSFSARGIKFGETGVRTGYITGDVYGLDSLEDFIGHYQGVVGGFLPGIGRNDVQLVNSKCVTIVARVIETGVSLSLEADQTLTIQFSDN